MFIIFLCGDMVNRLKIPHDKNIHQRIWKQDEIFDAIWNEKVNKFFDNYKQFDEFLVQKSNSILAYSWHIFLDAEVSWKLYLDFFNIFIQSIKWMVGEELYGRLSVYFKNKDYLLSNREKMHDSDPFLDDEFQCVLLWDNTVAQLSHRRNAFNNIEFNYIIYPNRIFSFINKVLKENNIKI